MGEKRFTLMLPNAIINDTIVRKSYYLSEKDDVEKLVGLLNEQQELIEELQVSDEMGWKRAEHFEKKCPKELHNKKMHIKRLEYKVQKFKEMNGEQQATIEELQQKYDKLCIEIANIYSKYIFMKEFSEDTNPNEAVKYVLRELMQKTKEAR